MTKLSTTFLALLLTVSLAQTPTETACEAIGTYLDAANELVSLEFVYSNSGTMQDAQEAMVKAIVDLGIILGSDQMMTYEKHELYMFDTSDKRYVFSANAASDDSWLVCGFEMLPQAPSSGANS